MRPPDLPGGNRAAAIRSSPPLHLRFNEAAGFTRRKRARAVVRPGFAYTGFNEAAGFTRRKRPPTADGRRLNQTGLQ